MSTAMIIDADVASQVEKANPLRPEVFCASESAVILQPEPFEWITLKENARAIPYVLEKGPDGYTATTPVLKGCIAEGDTPQQAEEDFVRAVTALLEAYEAEKRDVPWRKGPLVELEDPSVRVFTVLI